MNPPTPETDEVVSKEQSDYDKATSFDAPPFLVIAGRVVKHARNLERDRDREKARADKWKQAGRAIVLSRRTGNTFLVDRAVMEFERLLTEESK